MAPAMTSTTLPHLQVRYFRKFRDPSRGDHRRAASRGRSVHLSESSTFVNTSCSDKKMAASASSKPLQQALTQMIQRASLATAAHVDPAVHQLTASQDGLEAELQRLHDEMASVTSVLETVKLDPETSARMRETQECLKRTKKKLITIRGRLGRLRAYEESDRLQLSERSMDVIFEGTVGGGEGGEDFADSNVGVIGLMEDGKAAAEVEPTPIEPTNGVVSSDTFGAELVSPQSSVGNEGNTPAEHELT